MLQNISTHTPHARRDEIVPHEIISPVSFQLTRLMRGVTVVKNVDGKRVEISTHTPHARRDLVMIFYQIKIMISTHTPHARRDFLNFG